MRFIKLWIPLVCFSLMIGCAQHAFPPSSHESDALVLDNHGGYSHAGRRVALRPDGSYTDTRYTDVIGDEKVQRGHYSFDAEKTRLVLSPERGKAERLYRVNYGSRQYWVHEQNQRRIGDSGDAWFRQVSLSMDVR
jgi:hypothetical protein